MIQQYSLAEKAANGILDCIRQSFASSWLGRPHLQHCVQFRAPQYKKDTNVVENVRQRVTEMKGMEHPLLCGKSDTELGMFSLKKRKLREI